MAEYAPEAIRACFTTVKAGIPTAILSGIVGDKAHTYGYHRGRNYVSSGDYSVQRTDDKLGSGEAASALDISLNPVNMRLVTQRLIDATMRGDARVQVCREFFGTINGTSVTGLDVRDKRWVTSDSSHLWHVHISFYRRYADDHAALQQVAAVIGGGATPQPPGTEDELERIMAWYPDKQTWEAAWKKIAIEAVLEVVRKEGIPGNAAAAAQRSGNTANVVLEVVRSEGIPGNAAAAAQRSKQILDKLEGTQ